MKPWGFHGERKGEFSWVNERYIYQECTRERRVESKRWYTIWRKNGEDFAQGANSSKSNEEDTFFLEYSKIIFECEIFEKSDILRMYEKPAST